MDAVNERELVERCRRGDEGAFQELVDRYKDLVFALIARTVQDRSRAEDLAQDVFLRIHRGLPYFRGEARLSTWIYRIVANACLQDQRPSATRRSENGTSCSRRPCPSSAATSERSRMARQASRAEATVASTSSTTARSSGRSNPRANACSASGSYPARTSAD